MQLKEFLRKKKYQSIKLHKTKTNHFMLKARINGVKGSFIVDTGASNTCIDTQLTEKFKLKVEESDTKAAGAGAVGMETQQAFNVKIKIGKWRYYNLHLVIFDLTHVNTALVEYHAKPIDGIIGADILKKAKAIIDYDKNYLYFKKSKFLY